MKADVSSAGFRPVVFDIGPFPGFRGWKRKNNATGVFLDLRRELQGANKPFSIQTTAPISNRRKGDLRPQTILGFILLLVRV